MDNIIYCIHTNRHKPQFLLHHLQLSCSLLDDAHHLLLDSVTLCAGILPGLVMQLALFEHFGVSDACSRFSLRFERIDNSAVLPAESSAHLAELGAFFWT